MKFKFDHDPMCLFCEHAHKISESQELLCDFRGPVLEDYKCRKFKYNIFARNPRRKNTLDTSKYKKEDFEF